MIGRRDRGPSERDLAALADGSLPASRRASFERAVSASPSLQAKLAAQRRALDALDRASGAAPHALRARLALARDPRPRPRAPRLFAGTLAAITLVALVTMLAVGGQGAAAPSVADAATLGTRPALAPTGEPRRGSFTLPRLRAAGLSYPYWQDRFGFKALGVRRDRLGTRFATTVFYAHSGERIAYTIVSGPPLAVDAAAPRAVRDGIGFRSLSADGRRLVTWLRRGHTCVLSASSVSDATLVSLAAWPAGAGFPS